MIVSDSQLCIPEYIITSLRDPSTGTFHCNRDIWGPVHWNCFLKNLSAPGISLFCLRMVQGDVDGPANRAYLLVPGLFALFMLALYVLAWKLPRRGRKPSVAEGLGITQDRQKWIMRAMFGVLIGLVLALPEDLLLYALASITFIVPVHFISAGLGLWNLGTLIGTADEDVAAENGEGPGPRPSASAATG